MSEQSSLSAAFCVAVMALFVATVSADDATPDGASHSAQTGPLIEAVIGG